jgi:hypothetical protein
MSLNIYLCVASGVHDDSSFGKFDYKNDSSFIQHQEVEERDTCTTSELWLKNLIRIVLLINLAVERLLMYRDLDLHRGAYGRFSRQRRKRANWILRRLVLGIALSRAG